MNTPSAQRSPKRITVFKAIVVVAQGKSCRCRMTMRTPVLGALNGGSMKNGYRINGFDKNGYIISAWLQK